MTKLALLNRSDTHAAVRESGETAKAIGMLDNIRLLKSRLYLRATYCRPFSEGVAVFEMNLRSKELYNTTSINKVSLIRPK